MKKNVWIFNHYATNTYFDKGGRHYWFAKYLKKAGYNPVIFCANTVHNSSQMIDTKEKDYIEITDDTNRIPFVFVKVPLYKGNGISRIRNMTGFYRKLFKVTSEYIKKHEKPDIILASSVHPLTLIAGIKIAKKLGVKCICEIRDLWPESIVKFGKLKENSLIAKLLYKGEKWIYKKANALIFTMEGGSSYLKDQKWDIANGGPIDLNKVYYINNGIDLPVVKEQRKNNPYIDSRFDSIKKKRIIYAGSIRKANGVGVLLDTAKLLKDKNLIFCIFGDGEEREYLENRIKEENITNVLFFGKVQKKYIASIVSQASILLLLYSPQIIHVAKYGMSQNKFFDYLAGGNPIISNLPNPYSIINKYECGIERKFSGPEELAECIDKMLLDGKQIDKWRKKAESTAEKFSFEAHTERLIDIIEKI